MLDRGTIVVSVLFIACFAVMGSVLANGNDPLPTIGPTSGKIKIGESIVFTSSVSGGTPPFGFQWYLNDSAVLGATFDTWEFAPTLLQPIGNYSVYLVVEDGLMHRGFSNIALVTVAPALKVQISPQSASMFLGEKAMFSAADVSGGYPPYSLQWFLDGEPVRGEIGGNWPFTPSAVGVYYVSLRVIDTTNNTASSQAARVVVQSVPVGGYSVSLQKNSRQLADTACFALVILCGTILTLKKIMKGILR